LRPKGRIGRLRQQTQREKMSSGVSAVMLSQMPNGLKAKKIEERIGCPGNPKKKIARIGLTSGRIMPLEAG